MAIAQRARSRRWRSALSLRLPVIAVLCGCGSDAATPLALGVPTDAAVSQTMRVLTYNVAGLPESLVPSRAAHNSALMSPLLNGYDLVLLQEDFAYHDALLAASTLPYASTPDPSARALGDGLTMLATRPFRDFRRIPWNDCFGVMDSGSDCLTPKGFTFARLTVGTLGTIDVYDVHTDAGYSPGDVEARRKNLAQLAEAIRTLSADHALIVAGDFNERYENLANLQSFLSAIPSLRDAWQTRVAAAMDTDGRCLQNRSDSLSDPDDPTCERLDKIFYRSMDGLTLTPIEYRVEGARFVDEEGRQLSDHRPVSVVLAVSSS